MAALWEEGQGLWVRYLFTCNGGSSLLSAFGPPESQRERASLGMPLLTRKGLASPGSLLHSLDEPSGL